MNKTVQTIALLGIFALAAYLVLKKSVGAGYHPGPSQTGGKQTAGKQDTFKSVLSDVLGIASGVLKPSQSAPSNT